MFKKLAGMIKNVISVNWLVSALSKPMGVFKNELVATHNYGRPQPKHINARQAWKNRGKTSKRKGNR